MMMSHLLRCSAAVKQACQWRSTAHLRHTASKADALKDLIEGQIKEAKEAHTYKEEIVLSGPTGPLVRVQEPPHLERRDLICLCANNYLGLSNHPAINSAAIDTIKTHGFGLSSVRFICGTTDLHKALEARISQFHGTEDTILFPSGFDANTALFETILTAQDAVISDELNHASIIDGIRLCKARRLRFKHMDMEDLERQLQVAERDGARLKFIATDGVFSMDGDVCLLKDIVSLAKKYGAYTFVDDCHATGFVGPTGRGTDEFYGVQGHVDIISSTLGKALGGGTGGYITGRKDVVQLLRQKARPYLFSNSLAPSVCGASLKAFDLISDSTVLRDRCISNTSYFRQAMTRAGFQIAPGWHPIVAVHLGEAGLAKQMAASLLMKGFLVVGFSYPVVPKGKARIRVQISAAHTREQLDAAVEAMTATARELDIMMKAEQAATGVGL